MKYNTEEFIPDDINKDIVNTKELSLLWLKLLASPKKERKSIIRNLSNEMKSELLQYLKILESKKRIVSSDESRLFLLVVGHRPYKNGYRTR